jgi:hypothetical protein
VAVAVRSYPPAEVPNPDLAAVDGLKLAEKSSGADISGSVEIPTLEGTVIATDASEVIKTLGGEAGGEDAVAVDMPAAAVMNMVDLPAEKADIDGMESTMDSSKAPLRAVAIRRYPLPIQLADAIGPSDSLSSEDASAARKAVPSVARRLHRSKPRLALRKRYAREAAARARATQRRSGTSEPALAVSNVERLDLGPLPACVRPKVEKVVPDLLSAAGVVSTKGPFDCDEEAGLPTLTVSAKGRSVSGADAMALPMLEGVDVFEVRISLEV